MTALFYKPINFFYKISGDVTAICETEICIKFHKEENNLKVKSHIKIVT
jgi:hypothetical protein